LNPDFYRFWRSLEATKKVLTGKATLILRTDQGFFDVLTDPTRPLKSSQAPVSSPANESTSP